MPLPFTPPEVLDPSKVGEYPAQVGRRTDRTLPDFFAADAPPNRLAILRGTARRAP